MTRYFAIVPAGGSGSRMGADLPKQYLPLLGQPLVRHCLRTLLSVSAVERVTVVLAPDDTHWDRHDWQDLGPRLNVIREGGATRAASVTSGLRNLAEWAAEDDWVLVHDAARACLSPAQVWALIEALEADPVGGLLAQPVADTLKRAGPDARVAATVSRDGLWQAQTPQMFRYGLLRRALAGKPDVTDEAGAIEALGHAPRLVPADATNFKITWPEDLRLAAQILAARMERDA